MENDSLIIKEASNEVINKIFASNKNKIILGGPQGSGKTTTLKHLSQNYARGNSIIIYIDYSNFTYRSELNNSEYNYYYELVFAQKILEFIKANYYEYSHNFLMYEKFIKNEIDRFSDYLNTRYYCKNIINNFLNNDIINKIISLIRNLVPSFSINLIIDYFDTVGNSSKRFQEFMKNYFHLFDKVIITSNDEKLKDKLFQNDLKNKKYEILIIDYSKNVKFIKQILLNYFTWWSASSFLDINKVKKIKEIINMINSDTFCMKLIKTTKGNIDMMISIIRMYYMGNNNIETVILQVTDVYNKLEDKMPVKKLYL